jgi:alginate O-acetyltransferase complex protein AlgI
MLFNSFVFWIFFFFVICLYRRLSHTGQNRMLLVASYIFYGYWDYRFLSLIFISTVVDYFVANAIQDSEEQKIRKYALSVSIASNLGILGFFKYFDFFSNEVSVLFTGLGLDLSLPLLNVILPVGISFYTFQTMSYTIDVYRGVTKPTKKFLDFALYVSFFPQLVAGPIERSSHLLPQILKPRTIRKNDFSEGLYHVLTGLFKKIVIADNMAPIVNTIFSTPTSELSGLEVLVGVYAFAFQIYGDFSGYSSIAQGIAKWMGFDLMWNFRMPYFSVSPSDFWQRWHISLSSWLRDYLYISLGGNKGGSLFTFRNLAITMLLGGLWHGAGWTYMLWGLYHGLLLIAYRLFARNINEHKTSMFDLKHLFNIVLMFHFVCGSWLIFRADSVHQITGMVDALLFNFYITDFAIFSMAMIIFFSGPLMLFELWIEKSKDMLIILNINWVYRAMFYTYLLLMIIIFPPDKPQDFIYFQF